MVDEKAKPGASTAGFLPTQGYEGIDDVNDEEKEDNRGEERADQCAEPVAPEDYEKRLLDQSPPLPYEDHGMCCRRHCPLEIEV